MVMAHPRALVHAEVREENALVTEETALLKELLFQCLLLTEHQCYMLCLCFIYIKKYYPPRFIDRECLSENFYRGYHFRFTHENKNDAKWPPTPLRSPLWEHRCALSIRGKQFPAEAHPDDTVLPEACSEDDNCQGCVGTKCLFTNFQADNYGSSSGGGRKKWHVQLGR